MTRLRSPDKSIINDLAKLQSRDPAAALQKPVERRHPAQAVCEQPGQQSNLASSSGQRTRPGGRTHQGVLEIRQARPGGRQAGLQGGQLLRLRGVRAWRRRQRSRQEVGSSLLSLDQTEVAGKKIRVEFQDDSRRRKDRGYSAA